jgi:FKBP-type peptidyl-prolyl cis-trans isomerase FkpA
MLRRSLPLALVAGLILVIGCGGGGNGDGGQAGGAGSLDELSQGLQEASYALGVDMGRQVAGMPGSGDFDVVIRGMQDMLADEAKLDAMQAREIMAVHDQDHGEDGGHEHPDTWTENGFATEEAQRSYAIGVTLAQFASMQLAELDTLALSQGLTDRLGGEELLVAEDSTRTIITTFQRDLNERLATENLEAGQRFLAENARREDVVTTESGLQYEVLREGDGGVQPAADSTVKVHYHGTLIDGEVFDSSVDRGEPISFPLNRVIPGWTEGVQLMTPGAKYRFYIPTDLAYGQQVRPGSPIGPNEALIFEVELLEVQ